MHPLASWQAPCGRLLPGRIVFDSPAKTVEELRWALAAGVGINADSIDELDRIDMVMQTLAQPSKSMIGLRVNPILSGGKIAMFSVSRPDSKFGHALTTIRHAAVVDAFLRFEWLNGLHCHVGSAGTSLSMLARGAAVLRSSPTRSTRGVAAAAAAAVQLPRRGDRYRRWAASSLESDEVTPTFAEYAQCLREAAPSPSPTHIAPCSPSLPRPAGEDGLDRLAGGYVKHMPVVPADAAATSRPRAGLRHVTREQT